MDVRAVVMTILLVGYAPSIVLCGMALLSYSFLLRFSYRIRLMAPIALTATAFGSVVVIAYVIKGFANEPFHPIVLIAGLVLQVLHFIPMVLAVLTPIPYTVYREVYNCQAEIRDSHSVFADGFANSSRLQVLGSFHG